MMRATFTLSLAILCLITITGCSQSSQAPDAASSKVLISLPEGPLALVPISERDKSSGTIGQLISDGLIGYDSRLNRIPLIAESWEVDSEAQTVQFKLRSNAVWHDGQPVVAADVKATAEAIQNPANQAVTWGADFEPISRVEPLDDRTVVVHYESFPADPLAAWHAPLLPAHHVDGKPNLLESEFNQSPVGCGAFTFGGYLEDQQVTLHAFDDYWAGRPSIDTLIFKIISDDETQFQALLQGELDLVSLSPSLWTQSLPEEVADQFSKEAYYRLMTYYIGWNQDGSNPFFQDARVRQALTMALNRAQFNDVTMDGMAKLGVTAYHPDWPFYSSELAARNYDPQAAATLLNQAGWTDTDGDGVLDKDGQALRFTLLTNSSSREIVRRLLQWLQDEYRKIGVQMQIDTIEWAAFQKARKAHQFEAMLSTVSYGPSDDLYELFHSSGIENGFNYSGFSDPQIDALYEQLKSEKSATQRTILFHLIQARLYELEPLTNLFYMPTPILRSNRLKNVEYSPLGYLHIHPGPRAWQLQEGE